jgi:hypothetical protein
MPETMRFQVVARVRNLGPLCVYGHDIVFEVVFGASFSCAEEFGKFDEPRGPSNKHIVSQIGIGER